MAVSEFTVPCVLEPWDRIARLSQLLRESYAALSNHMPTCEWSLGECKPRFTLHGFTIRGSIVFNDTSVTFSLPINGDHPDMSAFVDHLKIRAEELLQQPLEAPAEWTDQA